MQGHYDSQFMENEQKALALLIAPYLHPSSFILEVGSWKGESTYVLGKAAEVSGGQVFCVDHWRGSAGTTTAEGALREDVLATFRRNMRLEGLESFVFPLVMESHRAASLMRGALFDIIFIDGDHRYSAVKQDILDWLPKLKEGGLLCGHDAERRFSEFSEEQQELIRATQEEDFNLDLGCHPGVVAALYDVLKDRHHITDTRIWYLYPDSIKEVLQSEAK